MVSGLPQRKHLVTRSFDAYERIVFGEVYIPNRLDTYDTAMTPEEVRRVAYDFMKRGLLTKIDQMHNYEESGCYVVESFVARPGDPDFIEGSWVLGTQIVGDVLWQRVLDGEVNGYSIAGLSSRQPAMVTLTKVSELETETDPNLSGPLPQHSHTIHMIFDSDGNIIPTWTTNNFGHNHEVLMTTATEHNIDHSHRFTVME
jgi:hypothetical protein